MATSSAPLFTPNVTLQAARGSAPGADVIVYDDFETGDFSGPTGNTSFSWDIDPADTRYDSTVDAISGTHSLGFLYPAGSNWNELRFSITEPGITDMWMSWWLRVPTNFYHNIQEFDSQENAKLFRVGQVSSVTSMGGMEFRPYHDKNQVDDGSAYMYIWPGSGSTDYADFAIVPRDLGRWMHIVYHIATETSPGAGDGVRAGWRKWQGESTYTLIEDKGPTDDADEGGFTQGYIMGYHNSAYTVDTLFLIDDFRLTRTDPRGAV